MGAARSKPQPKRLMPDNCPDAAKHTPCPKNYIQWHFWADRMSKTHKQVRCATCGLWTIWAVKGNGTKQN